MSFFSVGFLVGNCLLQLFPQLPFQPSLKVPDFLLVSLIVLAVFQYFVPKLRSFSLGIGLGAIWLILSAQMQLNTSLSPDKIGKNLIIQGVVADVPSYNKGVQRFVFVLSSPFNQTNMPNTLQLSVNAGYRLVQAGEKWQFTVRLSPIHGYANPGSFDVERWAFSQGIMAKGYVVDVKSAVKLSNPYGRYWIQALRERIAKNINKALVKEEKQAVGIVTALAVGVKADLSKETWQNLSKTGTSHLIAISGLHIGLIAGLVGHVVKKIWLLFPYLLLRYPAHKAAAIAGLLAAIGYSALAGFSLPTQRALLMVLSGAIALLSEKPLFTWQTFSWALLGVLLWDPLASLSVGFWLSFGAVGAILLVTASYPFLQKSRKKNILSQKAVFLGLIPITVVSFGGFSIISPLVNAIAIPYTSMIIVPLILLGVMLSSVTVNMATWLWSLAGIMSKGLLWVLAWSSAFPYGYFSIPTLSWISLLSVSVSAIVVITRCLPLWLWGIVGFLPLFFTVSPKLKMGELKVFFLDVGQGLSVVVQTPEHVLLYDTGASLPGGGSLAESVIQPFLFSQGIRAIDVLVLSHADDDHAGGADFMAHHFPISILYKNHQKYPTLHNLEQALCDETIHWNWEGVEFAFLNSEAGNAQLKANNTSCVLRISLGSKSILLPGDIEKHTEQVLVKNKKEQLSSTILLAPHHGSKTSSTHSFLEAVSPEIVIFSAGYRNRYHLPNAKILQRYDSAQIQQLTTAKTGTIELYINRNNEIYLISSYRDKMRHYWGHRGDEAI